MSSLTYAATSVSNEELLALVDGHLEKQDFSNEDVVRRYVGQLFMVGVPSDILEPTRKSTTEIISELGVGSIFLNTYNYYHDKNTITQNSFLTQTIHMHNTLQELGLKSEHGFPLILAIDFEGPGYSSLDYAVKLPPHALALGSTRDGQIIRDLGKLIGYQCRSIGIHAILGPVLDASHTKQGVPNWTLMNRSFGSDPRYIYNIASHYISGLQEGGVVCVAKHFPGHGVVESNPQSRELPVYPGSVEQLQLDLLPLPASLKMLNGAMTSHLLVPSLGNESRLVTFSRTFIDSFIRSANQREVSGSKVKGLGMNAQVLITDDLSDMSAILQYKKQYNKSFADIALDAFRAGHDILLFSHIECDGDPKRGKNAEFSIESLRECIKRLEVEILSDPELQLVFRASLRRVLLLKLRVHELCSHDPYTFFDEHRAPWSVTISKDIERILNPGVLHKDNYKDADSLIENICAKAITEISVKSFDDKPNYDLSGIAADEKVVVVAREIAMEYLQEPIRELHSKTDFVTINYTKKSYNEFNSRMLHTLSDYHKFIFVAEKFDDFNTIDFLRLNARSELLRKGVVFLHDNPAMLRTELLGAATILGNFTNHPMAYTADYRVLSGALMPRKIDSLPIELGEAGSFHKFMMSGAGVPFVEPASGFGRIEYFATEEERQLTERVHELESVLERVQSAKVVDKDDSSNDSRKYPWLEVLGASLSTVAAIALLYAIFYVRRKFRENPSWDSSGLNAVLFTLFREDLRAFSGLVFPLLLFILGINLMCRFSLMFIFFGLLGRVF